jgi:hypothetical protein
MDAIKDILAGVIEKIACAKPKHYDRLQEVWQEIAGKKAMQHSKVAGIKDDQILIYVDSSAWLYQMNLEKEGSLNKFKQVFPETKRLFFKIGKVI